MKKPESKFNKKVEGDRYHFLTASPVPLRVWYDQEGKLVSRPVLSQSIREHDEDDSVTKRRQTPVVLIDGNEGPEDSWMQDDIGMYIGICEKLVVDGKVVPEDYILEKAERLRADVGEILRRQGIATEEEDEDEEEEDEEEPHEEPAGP
jgi:hypothetical protein